MSNVCFLHRRWDGEWAERRSLVGRQETGDKGDKRRCEMEMEIRWQLRRRRLTVTQSDRWGLQYCRTIIGVDDGGASTWMGDGEMYYFSIPFLAVCRTVNSGDDGEEMCVRVT